MSDFTFSSTAECDVCGAFLSSSDEECDHDAKSVDKHVFRKLGEGRDSLVGVKTTANYKWYALEEKVGEDWIAYQYLGPKGSVENMASGPVWDSIEDLPHQTMAVDAPSDVGENS